MTPAAPPPAPGDDPDAVLAALDELTVVTRDNIEAWQQVFERIEQVRALRKDGVAYGDMRLADGGEPIIGVVAKNQERLTVVAAQLRRALARELVAEGWSYGDIGAVFGVSRQRVGALLRPSSPGPDTSGDQPERAPTAD